MSKYPLSLAALLSVTLSLSACEDVKCKSGIGYVSLQNNSGESILIEVANDTGNLLSKTIDADSTQKESVPIDAYTVKATGETSGRLLLEQSYGVRCNAITQVVINPLPRFNLDATVTGNGTVTSNPTGIDCTSTTASSGCQASFITGTQVTLIATSGPDSQFAGWSGACSGTGDCTVTMNQSRNVGAVFVQIADPFTVMLSGTGTGKVTSNPSGISCSNDGFSSDQACSTEFIRTTPVTLTATPGPDSEFVRWTGGCVGTALTCTTTAQGAKNVTAEFRLGRRGLTVSRSGNGTGVITSSSGGIDCGTSCSAEYDLGTTITLTATAQLGSEFAGWTGACSGDTPSCEVKIDEAKSVTAQFNLALYSLGVTVQGSGSGTVHSSPQGILCGQGQSACTADFEFETVVTLTATPASDSTFAGWSGSGCSVSGSTCTVNVEEAKSVVATFNKAESLTAPLVSFLSLGQKKQGQIQGLGIGYYIATTGLYPSEEGSANSDGIPYIGQIMMFAGSQGPGGWLPCDGRLLSISQYTALFSLLGTQYGGDGKTTFGIPDLRARVAVGRGSIVDAQTPPTGQGNSVVPLINSITRAQVSTGQVQGLGVRYLLATIGLYPSRDGDSTYGTLLGHIILFAGSVTPRGWIECNGSLLSIRDNQALFSLLGTYYGGDGRTTFGVPDLRARVPMHPGSLLSPPTPPTSSTQIPLITQMQPGAVNQGQIGVTGIGHYIAAAGTFPAPGSSEMSEGAYVGEIRMFAGNFSPGSWLPCNGASWTSSENQVLHTVLGETFGTGGSGTFRLPDLSARVPMGIGTR